MTLRLYNKDSALGIIECLHLNDYKYMYMNSYECIVADITNAFTVDVYKTGYQQIFFINIDDKNKEFELCAKTLTDIKEIRKEKLELLLK